MDTGVMGVVRQASSSATGRLVCELKAEGQAEGQHIFEKRLAIAKQVVVDHFIVEIDGDSAILTCLYDYLAQVSTRGHQVS
jgi:hypothetical protein